jgi:hypothetical protein
VEDEGEKTLRTLDCPEMYRLDITLPVIDIFDGAKAEDNEIYAPGYLQCKLRVMRRAMIMYV